MRFIVMTGNACNCRCDYCYERGAAVHAPDADKIWKTLSALIDSDGGASEEYGLHFIGGEPLLWADGMDWLIERYIEKVTDRCGLVSLISNGANIVSDRKIQRYLRKWSEGCGMEVRLSIDGGQANHDRHRPLADGSGSWQWAVSGLKWCMKNMIRRVMVSAVVTAESCSHWADEVIELIRLGAPYIGIGPDRAHCWTAEESETLYHQFVKIINYAIDNRVRCEIPALFARRRSGSADIVKCDICGSLKVISHDGEVFPCHILASRGDRSFDMAAYREANAECMNCEYLAECIKCPAELWTLKDQNPWKWICGYTRARAKAADYARRRLKAVREARSV